MFAIIACLVCAGAAAAQPAVSANGSWVGTMWFRAPAGVEPEPISVELRGRRAVVSLAQGHAARTVVAAAVRRGRVRISLPGRPGPLVLAGRVRRGQLSGSVRQGRVRGRFSLARGAPLPEASLGLYRFADGRSLGVWSGEGARIATVYDDDELRGLYRTRGSTYAIGAGLQTRNPTSGTARFAATYAMWRGARANRVAVRQQEVWVLSGRAQLGCTLSIPPGSGRRPAIAFAHGAGSAPRAYNSNLATFLNSIGIVTLSCDKRGIGQSGGAYPGEFPSTRTVDEYARDVQAQARWLARQPEVDATKIGVAGPSQAGWIMPLAASREPAIRFMLGLVSPTLTVGETDLWADLNGHGRSMPTRSDEDMEAEVRAAGPSGFDPMPAIRAMRVPALWLYGGKDRTVPSRLCVARLDPVTREPGRDFSYLVFPGGTHGLVLTENGLIPEQARSSRFVEGLFREMRDWLAVRSFTASLPAS